MAIFRVTETALYTVTELPTLIYLAKKSIDPKDHSTHAAIDRVFLLSDGNSYFAKQEMLKDFQTVRSHHIVSIWAATETAIEQLLVNHITTVGQAPSLIQSTAPKIRIDSLKRSNSREARKTLRLWESHLPQDSSVERALTMLSTFGIAPLLPSPDIQRLTEMSEIRNVIMHNGGSLDDTFLKKCPWIDQNPGTKFVISSAMMESYFNSTQALALSFMGKLQTSPHINQTGPSKPG